MLTLIGLHGDHPPTDPQGFHRFASSLGTEDLVDAIHSAEPSDDPVGFRFPASSRRRYEDIRLPGRLLIVGDSLCSFNPVYGQGISVAALEAQHIGRQLADDHRLDTRKLIGALATIVEIPWAMTRAADRPFLASEAGPGLGERLLSSYLDRVQRAATHEVAAGAAFLRVSGLIDQPRSLFGPATIWRALRAKESRPTRESRPDRPQPSEELTRGSRCT